MKRPSLPVARRFARAFLRVYGSCMTDAVRQTLANLLAQFEHAHNRLIFLGLNSITAQRKVHALALLCDTYHLPEQFKTLMTVLVEKRAALALPLVLQEIVRQDQEAQSIERFIIASSHPLDGAQRQIFETFLHQQTGKQIRTSYQVAPELIAGVRMLSSEHLWEHTLSQRLEAIYRQQAPETLKA